MRQAALRAALADRPPTADDVKATLDDLLDERAALTRRLLGQPADGAAPDTPASPTFGPMVHAIGGQACRCRPASTSSDRYFGSRGAMIR
jgi:hypothetical protein